MADDRMYLRCRCCGESIMVDKMWKSRAWMFNNDVGDFIKKHQYCGDSIMLNKEADSFELCTENGIGYPSIDDDVKWTLNLKDIKDSEQYYENIIESKNKEVERLEKLNRQYLDNIQKLKNMLYNKEHNEDR